MSTINTNSINVNYPVPGVNNNSQGFRDNFASIKTNLDEAGTELTDLQNKVVVKQALTGATLNNDMANTLISNALTRSFRASTYNLGNALSGTVLVNVALGDVQYGTIAANSNVTLQFGSWAPAGTQSNVQLLLAVNDSNSYVNFTGTNVDSSKTILENYSANTVFAPNGVTQLNYSFSTTDCGNTITVQPTSRPRQIAQIQTRIVSPTGFQGDVAGDIAMTGSISQLTISNTTTSTNIFTTTSTSQLYTDQPIVFTGTAFGGPTVGTTYYVRYVASSTTFTVSTSIGGSNLALSTANATSGPMYANPVRHLFMATQNYNATPYTTSVTATATSGNITLSGNVASLVTNAPIIFNSAIGGIVANTVYYIKSKDIGNSNITVSQSRTNGVSDTVVTLTANSVATTATFYVGADIWKRIALSSW